MKLMKNQYNCLKNLMINIQLINQLIKLLKMKFWMNFLKSTIQKLLNSIKLIVLFVLKVRFLKFCNY